MPCTIDTHSHQWVTEGELVIERCEKQCAFCHHSFQSGWFIRRHVSSVHCGPGKDYPNLVVLKGWKDRPDGNARPHSDESVTTNRRVKKEMKRKKAMNTIPDQETTTVADVTHSFVAPTPFSTGPALVASTLSLAPPINFNTAPAPVVSQSDATDLFDFGFTTNDIDSTGTSQFPVCKVTSSSSAAMAPEATGRSGPSTPEPMNSIDPKVLFEGNTAYTKTTSPWSVVQNVRTDGSRIKAIRPLVPIDDGADTVRRSLNTLFASVRLSSQMTDEEILGTAQSYLKAFANGSFMSPITPTAPPFPESADATFPNAAGEVFPDPTDDAQEYSDDTFGGPIQSIEQTILGF
ncbi:uncharacterized protein LTR77_000253 [Saxophila tyrrhenica]|uniref:C2H2-type domain-containing protein n=1 Tax=Saxophila tyrrhenica TaxID=1690608 RepID=A0AAV9PN25_9PEZI|nr:hypothetical protein LTR77_000253 [Saxophila tyrrhenica]